MAKADKLNFNPASPTVLHLDINSCFATIEQQANPKLRGKPIAVAAYDSPLGCILAPSIEAKRMGIKTGMRVKDGRKLYPRLVILPPDPQKYRNVHIKMKKILNTLTDNVQPRSIDEFVMDFKDFPIKKMGMTNVGLQIKERIKKEIGGWIKVSIGISTNKYLAKVAAGLKKPDGLEEINAQNYKEIYKNLDLIDLCGIKAANALRLNRMGIFTVTDFYKANVWTKKAAFESIVAHLWHARLLGWEVDDVVFARRSYGNSYVMPQTLPKEKIQPVLQKLVEKTGFRLRRAGYRARGVGLALTYADHSFWHQSMTLPNFLFDSRDICKAITYLLSKAPAHAPVRALAESVFNLEKIKDVQQTLFEDMLKKEQLVKALDTVNERWGIYTITPARMLGTQKVIPDRIAFGGVKELEEIIID